MFTLPDFHLGYVHNLPRTCPLFGVWRIPEVTGGSWLIAIGRWELVISL